RSMPRRLLKSSSVWVPAGSSRASGVVPRVFLPSFTFRPVGDEVSSRRPAGAAGFLFAGRRFSRGPAAGGGASTAGGGGAATGGGGTAGGGGGGTGAGGSGGSFAITTDASGASEGACVDHQTMNAPATAERRKTVMTP